MDEIRPALTAEEWAELEYRDDDETTVENDRSGSGLWIERNPAPWRLSGEREAFGTYLDRRHALAALALHGQTFGFTHEDVERIRLAANAARWEAHRLGEQAQYPEQSDAKDLEGGLRDLAARLAALLPPRP